MKAFVVIPDPCAQWLAMANGRTPASLPILDRSVLQHAVESLVGCGVRDIHVVAFIGAERAKSLLQDGMRWGANISVTTQRNWGEIVQTAREYARGNAIWVVNSEHIPDLSTVKPEDRGILVSDEGPTGWAIVEADQLGSLEALINGRKPDGLPEISVPCSLSVATPAALSVSWAKVIARRMPLMVQTGREKDPGIVIGRGAKIDPTAKVSAPAYIGENSIIGKDCVVGPGGFVCTNSIVEEGSRIVDAVVFPSTYVGKNLDLDRKIASRSSILDYVRGIAVPVTDEFLIGSTKADRTSAPPMAERLLVALVAFLLWPLTLFGALVQSRRPLQNYEIGYANPTQDLFFRVLPGLWRVVMGRSRVVGVPLLPLPVLQGLEPEVRRALTSVPQGLISETYLLFGPCPSEDDLWASSAFLAAGRGQSRPVDIFRTYLELALGSRKPQW